MIETPTSAQWGLLEAMEDCDSRGIRGLRWQAAELLRRLQQSRALSEQRAAETGRRDPMKAVTGRSALDSAIASTRGMIERMDALLLELDDELTAHVDDRHNGRQVLEVGSRA